MPVAAPLIVDVPAPKSCAALAPLLSTSLMSPALGETISTWAPAHENNPDAYAGLETGFSLARARLEMGWRLAGYVLELGWRRAGDGQELGWSRAGDGLEPGCSHARDRLEPEWRRAGDGL